MSAMTESLPRSTNQEKHESGNPILRYLIGRFHRRICDWIGSLDVRSVLDVGCGEGFVARDVLAAHPHLQYTGLDPSEESITLARQRCPQASFHVAGVDDLPLPGLEPVDLVVCIEVLEHLADPHAALERLAGATSRYALLTVPWEPWFILSNLMRGKYLRTWGNHPEHVNHWSARGFGRFARSRFEVLRLATSYPWTMCLCRRPP